MFLRRVLISISTLALVCLGLSLPAEAFKPYTHVQTGQDARSDAIDNGKVTIDGAEYAVDPKVVAALRDWPSYYNAGVIGPDGFPDLAMGQSVIHPEDTGLWLTYLLRKAWEAQDDPQYGTEEKSQILAFVYGFLTHAAGDLWAHTMVNQLSEGIFPAVDELLSDPEKASIALKHLISEGYVGDATRFYDGNPERGPAPGGDISDDSTPGIAFDAPIKFIYNTLVKRDNGSPTNKRGPILDRFYQLRAGLASFVGGADIDPVGDALAHFNSLQDSLDDLASACNFDGIEDSVGDAILCPIKAALFGIEFVGQSVAALLTLAGESVAWAAQQALKAYASAWIDDIDAGLRDWGELGLAATRALFDPQTRRDLQNEKCAWKGAESDQLRIDCEDGIGMIEVVLDESDDFLYDHLLSMLGAPDVAVTLAEALATVSDAVTTAFQDALGPVLNPILNPLAILDKAITDYIKKAIEDRFELPISDIEEFLENPSAWMRAPSVSLGSLGTISLFDNGEADLLDSYLGLTAADHKPSGALTDTAAFDEDRFAAYQNTVTTAKLLLLDGPTLNAVLSTKVGHPYALYGTAKTENIMTRRLGGSDGQWLKLIDGDHAWRQDGKPVFNRESAGTGDFPLWESCVLRERAFRGLFTDWENGTADFPDLGDATGDGVTSNDPNDPQPPTATFTTGTPTYVAGGRTYVTSATPLSIATHDGFWSDSEISLAYRVTPDGQAPGPWQPTGSNAGTVTVGTVGDGLVHVQTRSVDPCGVREQSFDVYVDNTPPEVTYQQPALAQYDTDDLSSIQYSVTDPGSGVASHSVTLDGAASSNGAVLDMFWLDAGIHTIVVTATDNVGNTATTPRQFRVRATTESLLSNLERAWSLGLITDRKVYDGLKDSLLAAQQSHLKKKHPTEWNQLTAYINQLEGQRGHGIDRVLADRWIGYALDLIASKG
ncbi:hypothetical protein FHP29_12705 [Nocardioides albidus]|uniref:Phospholipase C/D domain-containing protein n=1 Tax=Nocardioides albidus TaxID=1517589 RepID=A0A5C4VWZ0_9ACTN|nr:hypothetical protein [Nocardioides albidus]TNM39719.1 hypothetical protein FHP29_12705 [Nocardioides albidus]